MKPFAAKLRSSEQILGLVISEDDIAAIQNGESLTIDLSSVGVGLWIREQDGSRTFLQPRDSNLVVIAGSSNADIGRLLQINLPPSDEIKTT